MGIAVFLDLFTIQFGLVDEHSEIVSYISEFSFFRGNEVATIGIAQKICPKHLINAIRRAGDAPVTTTPPIIMVLEDAIYGEVTVAVVFTATFGGEYVNFLLANTEGVGEVGVDYLDCMRGFFSQLGELVKETQLRDG